MKSGSTLLPPAHPHPESPTGEAEALFREATHRRRRRRRLTWFGLGVVVVAAVVGARVAGSPPRPSSHQPTISASRAAKSAGLPVGPIVRLEHAGPLAVGPTGALFVVDTARHEVVVHLANGQFRVVAGDGRDGFGGDGGPATRARLSTVSDITFAPNGDLYIADGGRVRVVDGRGTIRTIAGDGDGQSGGTVTNGAPARAASLSSPVFIAFSPTGELYLATSSQLLRLSSTHTLDLQPAVVTSGPHIGAFFGFGPIAVDALGNVFTSTTYSGWSVYRISPDGTATYLGYDRRSGGNVAVLERGADGSILADNGSDVVRVERNRLATSYSFGTFDKTHRGSEFYFLEYFAVAPNGTIYADDLGPPAFERYQQVVSVDHGRTASLWRGRTEK